MWSLICIASCCSGVSSFTHCQSGRFWLCACIRLLYWMLYDLQWHCLECNTRLARQSGPKLAAAESETLECGKQRERDGWMRTIKQSEDMTIWLHSCFVLITKERLKTHLPLNALRRIITNFIYLMDWLLASGKCKFDTSISACAQQPCLLPQATTPGI